MQASDNSVELFFLNHVQIHLRLQFALYFKVPLVDPLPETYLNSVIVLLNNIRDILVESGEFTLYEYFSQYLAVPYNSSIPQSMLYINRHIDLNLDDNVYLIDTIINKTASELGPIPHIVVHSDPPVKKETLEDIAFNKKKHRKYQTSNPFTFVSM